MKFLRYKEGKTECRGFLDGTEIKRIDGSIFYGYQFSGYKTEYNGAEILPPVLPSKILAPVDSESESGELCLYIKPSTSVSSHEAALKVPRPGTGLNAAGKLAVFIGKKCRKAAPENAGDYILGYSAACDAYLNIPGKTMTPEAGYYDGLTPLGPVIETDPAALGATVKTTVNGALKSEYAVPSQKRIARLISELSFMLTLLPGDAVVIGNGRPRIALSNGDRIEIEIDGLETLRNYAEIKHE